VTPPVPRRLLPLFAAALIAPAAPARAQAVALAPTGRGTRVTVPLPPGARWRLSALDRPPRLVLDLGAARWAGPRPGAGSGLVSGLRLLERPTRLVLDLAGPVAAPQASEAGGVLTLDLAPGPAASFARLPGRVLASGGAAPLPLVVLDPGHGGRDPGAIGSAGTREKDVVLAASQALRRAIEASGTARVAMTRNGDRFVPLAERVAFARARGAALFVSVHADSAPGARGASVYTLAEQASDAMTAALARRENAADAAGGLRLPPADPEVTRILVSLVRRETQAGSARLARLAVGALDDVSPMLSNPHREAAFAVLKAPDIPSVLVELGFLSHPADEAALRRPQHRARLAEALARAIGGYVAQA
jgi:N-acetylmuramoyl-L-alanine amidase